MANEFVHFWFSSNAWKNLRARMSRNNAKVDRMRLEIIRLEGEIAILNKQNHYLDSLAQSMPQPGDSGM